MNTSSSGVQNPSHDDALSDMSHRNIDEHPADIAVILGKMAPEDSWPLLKQEDIRRRAHIFSYLPHDYQSQLAAMIPRAALAALVMEMKADDRADLFLELSEEQREALLPALAQAERENIRQLASYDEDSAGAIMTSQYAAIPMDLSATAALTLLRQEATAAETINRAYVIDQQRKLMGVVRLQDIITAPTRARITDIMDANTHAIRANDSKVEAARLIARYDVTALPVVDEQGLLVGIITHDDAHDVFEAEATDDFHRVATITNLDSSVATASVPKLYRARISWLMLLVFGNIFSGAGIAHFEDTIAAHLALMFFLPILIASGGNAGSQSATLMIRALATGDIALTDWGRVFARELGVAVLLGISMAAAIAVIGVFRGGQQIALVIAMSMILIVIVGSLIGMLLPFLLSRFRMDPATASTPLVTSIADATGVIIYFTIARAVLVMP